MAWPTLNLPAPALTTRALVIYDDPAWIEQVMGALDQLCHVWNFFPDGNATPEEQAMLWYEQLKLLEVESFYVTPGTVLYTFATSLIPSFALWCDGAAYDIADYPKLYEVIGNRFGSSPPGTFRVPNLAGRFLVGVGTLGGDTYAQDDVGGESQHTLDITELPGHVHAVDDHMHYVAPHTHGYMEAGPSISLAGPDPSALPAILPAMTAPDSGQSTSAAGAQNTTSSGGDQPHENRPPYLAVKAYIIAR